MAGIRQVFISHDRNDAAFAHQLADDLKQFGVTVWIAPDSIEPGEGWVAAINRGLEESSHMLVVLTPSAIGSKWVKRETNIAIDQEHAGRMTMIPLDVESCKIPLLWRSYQMISFRSSYAAGFHQLANALGLRIVGPASAPPPTPPPRRASGRRAGSMNPAITASFKAVLAEVAGLDVAEIRDQDHLIRDLHLDDLDLTELVMAVEDRWNLSIPDDDLGGDFLDGGQPTLITVQDWVRYLSRRSGV